MAPHLRAISFDLFDTLVDLPLEEMAPVRVGGEIVSPTAPLLHALVNEVAPMAFEPFALALRGIDREVQKRQRSEGREVSTRERFERLLATLDVSDAALVERLRAAHMGRLRRQVRELAHHPALLRALRARVPLGLCSNFTDSATALAVLDAASLRESLAACAISDTVGFRKPRREIFDALLRELGVAPEEVLHVGDNLDADVAGAKAAGLRTVWLTRRVADPAAARARHEGPLPDYTIADLAELTALVERLA